MIGLSDEPYGIFDRAARLPLTGDDPLNCEGGSDLIGRERHASAGPEL